MATMDTTDTMDRTGRIHIQPGMDVFDIDAHKVGSVVHLHEGAGSGANAGEDVIEVKTGFLGLGKHLFIPRGAVKDVTEGGVFLSASRDRMKELGWETRPSGQEVVATQSGQGDQSEPSAVAAVEAATWEEAMPHYRTRCFEVYGNDARWERYEPRYRFAWEMRGAPDLAGQSWSNAETELRRRWEVMHPEDDWVGASETIRDGWEHGPAGR